MNRVGAVRPRTDRLYLAVSFRPECPSATAFQRRTTSVQESGSYRLRDVRCNGLFVTPRLRPEQRHPRRPGRLSPKGNGLVTWSSTPRSLLPAAASTIPSLPHGFLNCIFLAQSFIAQRRQTLTEIYSFNVCRLPGTGHKQEYGPISIAVKNGICHHGVV